MEIDRTITSVWRITLDEQEVFNRVTDESLLTSYQRAQENAKGDGNVITDDDRAYFERYYRAALAELSVLLARRTTRVGGSITSTKDETTGFLTTVYTLPMSANHEDELVPSLASHCLEFVIARVLEKWYGHGLDFGSDAEKDEIRHIIHFRRWPIERPGSGLYYND